MEKVWTRCSTNSTLAQFHIDETGQGEQAASVEGVQDRMKRAGSGPAIERTSSRPAAPPSCEAEWVTTSNECKACVERPEGWLRYMQKTANPSSRWSGACKDGLIEGKGVLTWFSGEDEGWRTVLNTRYPAVAGVPAFKLRSGDVTVRYATNLSDGNVGYDKECTAISDVRARCLTASCDCECKYSTSKPRGT